MSSRIEVYRLIPGDLGIDASGGDVTYNSTTLDLRVNVPRINSVVARGISASSQPDYKVFWYGGITTSEIMGTATGEIDRFEEPDVNAPLISTYPGGVLPLNPGTSAEGYEAWIVAPLPAILTPYVRFHLLVKGGSPAGAKFNLYAYVQHRFDV